MSQNHLDQLQPHQFTQFIANNVDLNLKTIDGNNTFHGMRMRALITPALESFKLVPRKNECSETLFKFQAKLTYLFTTVVKKKFKNLSRYLHSSKWNDSASRLLSALISRFLEENEILCSLIGISGIDIKNEEITYSNLRRHVLAMMFQMNYKNS